MSERYIEAGTKATFSLADPDSVPLKFTLTMTAGEWRAVMRQLPSDGSNAGRIGLMIAEMVGKCTGYLDREHWTTGYATGEKD